MADLLERPCPLSVHQWKQFQGLWRACRQSAWQGVSIGAAGEQRAPSLGTRAELSEWQQEGFLAGLGGLQGWDPPHARMLLGDSSLPGPLGPSYRPSTPGSPLASKVAPHPLPRPPPSSRQEPAETRLREVPREFIASLPGGQRHWALSIFRGTGCFQRTRRTMKLTANCTWPKTGTPKLRYRRPPRVGPRVRVSGCTEAQRPSMVPAAGKGGSSPAWPVPEHHCPRGPCPGHGPGLPVPPSSVPHPSSLPLACLPVCPLRATHGEHCGLRLWCLCPASKSVQAREEPGSRAPGCGPGATPPPSLPGTQHPSPARPSLGRPPCEGWAGV